MGESRSPVLSPGSTEHMYVENRTLGSGPNVQLVFEPTLNIVYCSWTLLFVNVVQECCLQGPTMAFCFWAPRRKIGCSSGVSVGCDPEQICPASECPGSRTRARPRSQAFCALLGISHRSSCDLLFFPSPILNLFVLPVAEKYNLSL